MNSDKKIFEKGLSLYSKQKYKEALKVFDSLTDPSFEIMKFYHMGLTKIQLGQLEEGLKEYRKIHEIDRTVQGVEYDTFIYSLYINLGSTLQVLAKKKGKTLYEEAIVCYNYALQVKDNDARVWNNLGNAYLEITKYLDAIKSFKKAIELNDEYPEAHYSLSLVYESLAQYENAIEQLKYALHWKSRSKVILNRLAALCFGTGKFKEAKGFAERVLEINNDDPTANKNMALILYNMKEYEEANLYYQNLLKLNPNYHDPETQGIFEDLKMRLKEIIGKEKKL